MTVDEVWQLGAWLKGHETARQIWPADVIAPHIQAVLLDGYVTTAELRRIEDLLKTVHKEWVQRREQQRQESGVGPPDALSVDSHS